MILTTSKTLSAIEQINVQNANIIELVHYNKNHPYQPLLKSKIHYDKSMRKFGKLVFIIFLLTMSPTFADDIDFWDESMKIDAEAKNQQKSVTNQEFEKVLNFLQRNKKKKEDKKKPKGSPVWQSSAPEEEQKSISNILNTAKQDYPTVMVPVTLITPNGTEITPGFYRMLSAKNDTGYYINFYQGNSLVAKTKAHETGNDHNQDSLNYAKLMPVGDEYMRVIYGDIDCNIETELRIKPITN